MTEKTLKEIEYEALLQDGVITGVKLAEIRGRIVITSIELNESTTVTLAPSTLGVIVTNIENKYVKPNTTGNSSKSRTQAGSSSRSTRPKRKNSKWTTKTGTKEGRKSSTRMPRV